MEYEEVMYHRVDIISIACVILAQSVFVSSCFDAHCDQMATRGFFCIINCIARELYMMIVISLQNDSIAEIGLDPTPVHDFDQ